MIESADHSTLAHLSLVELLTSSLPLYTHEMHLDRRLLAARKSDVSADRKPDRLADRGIVPARRLGQFFESLNNRQNRLADEFARCLIADEAWKC
jgi:hypothetical protein